MHIAVVRCCAVDRVLQGRSGGCAACGGAPGGAGPAHRGKGIGAARPSGPHQSRSSRQTWWVLAQPGRALQAGQEGARGKHKLVQAAAASGGRRRRQPTDSSPRRQCVLSLSSCCSPVRLKRTRRAAGWPTGAKVLAGAVPCASTEVAAAAACIFVLLQTSYPYVKRQHRTTGSWATKHWG